MHDDTDPTWIDVTIAFGKLLAILILIRLVASMALI